MDATSTTSQQVRLLVAAAVLGEVGSFSAIRVASRPILVLDGKL